MRDTYNDASQATLGTIEHGWDVYGDDDEHLGTVQELGDNYLLIQKGLIFTKDIYVPFSAVTDAVDGVVRVNVGKDELETMGWDTAPLASDGRTDMEGAANEYGANDTIPAHDFADQHDATDDFSSGAGTTGGSMGQSGSMDQSDRTTMALHEEDLEARTTARQTGEVELRKEIIEEQRTIQVPVQREEVHIRRIPADGTSSVDDASFSGQGDTLRVPVMEEEVQVTKRPRVREQVEVQKVTRQDTENVTDTVRREELNVSPTGDVDALDDQTGRTGGRN